MVQYYKYYSYYIIFSRVHYAFETPKQDFYWFCSKLLVVSLNADIMKQNNNTNRNKM